MQQQRFLIVFLLAIFGVACSPAPEVGREVFQVTLGTRAELQMKLPATDNFRFIEEAANGDIVVAGYGASRYTDFGEWSKPMIARIDPSGAIKWKRIYAELENENIQAFATNREHQYIVFSKYVRDPTGRSQQTETITLRSIDQNGMLSAAIGRLDSVNIRGTTSIADDELRAFVFAASDGKNLSTRPYREQRDIALYEMDLQGNIRQLPFPRRIKSLQFFQHVGNRNFIYLHSDWRTNEPPTIYRVDENGVATTLIEWPDPQYPMSQVFSSGDRIFVVDRGIAIHDLLAYSDNGDELWRHRLDSRERITALAPLGSGGLIYSRIFEGNPIITSLTKDGQVRWRNRFKSTMQSARILGIRELEDQWIALAGSTGPGKAAYRDSDAVLLVTDPRGDGMSRYQRCLADAAAIERLREELRDKVGIEVRQNYAVRQSDESGSQIFAIDAKVSEELDCGILSEHDLQDFLQRMVVHADKLGLAKSSAWKSIDIYLSPPDSLPSEMFWLYNRTEPGRGPTLYIELGHEEAAAQYIAEEMLPFAERARGVLDRLQAIADMRIEPDRKSLQRGSALSFGDMVQTAEEFITRFDALNRADKDTFNTLYSGKSIVFSPENDSLSLWYDVSIHVGRNRIDDLFDYLLLTLPALQAEIRTEELAISKLLNISLRKDYELAHETYLTALRVISSSGNALSAADRSRIQQTEAFVVIGNSFESDIQIQDANRYILVKPTAADRILDEVIVNGVNGVRVLF